jgi:hypothetical protein
MWRKGKAAIVIEIPNPQVLDVARQYREGFCLLIRQPLGSGVLLPALHCAAIALELYLKALSAHEVEVPNTGPVGGAYIYARSPSKSHRLEELFDQTPDDVRERIEKASAHVPGLKHFSGGVREAFQSYSPMFVASRYPFEPDRRFGDIDIGTLDELLQLLDSVCKSTHRFVLTETETPVEGNA